MNKKLLLASTVFSSVLTYGGTVSAKTVNMIGDVDFSKPDRNFQDSSGKYTNFQNGDDIIVTGRRTISIPGGVEPIINSITVNNPVNNITIYSSPNTGASILIVGLITGLNSIGDILIGTNGRLSSLVLTGNNYSALNTIQIVNVPGTSFTGQQGILEINSPVTLNSPIIIDTKTVSAANS
ncbi:MAG: hypothetical protein LN588_03300 [Rickettsia endosymbiont of Bryobia graminum]|nr:hypothetical protein [Rickettsia endosymbiont of Bryobia graminum]